MDKIFGSKPDEKAVKRQNQRELRAAQRELATDRWQMERREKELVQEIKKLAKQGQREACTVLAKQLVALRHQKTKSLNTGALISATQAKTNQVSSLGTMAKVMGASARAMGQVNAQMPAGQLQRQMDAFARESALMDMNEEVIGETLDSMLDVDEAEEDRVIGQVLDELGLEMGQKLSALPRPQSEAFADKKPIATSTTANKGKATALPAGPSGSSKAMEDEGDDAELERLLAELTKPPK